MARILVIEDDVDVQALMCDVLSESGHLVFRANDGREGLSRYRHVWVPETLAGDFRKVW